MDEQRYVVEITRPVPPEKVEQVAQRIAERLNVPVDRIVTLLDGRMGEVTKPVLADKADAIAEVFAEAGVRVVVAAARVTPPQYEERFGQPHEAEERTSGPDEPAAMTEEPAPYPALERDSALEPDPAPEPDCPPEPEFPEPEPPEPEPDDTVPWGQDVTWGFDAKAAQAWSRPERSEEQRDDEHARDHEGTAFAPADPVGTRDHEDERASPLEAPEQPTDQPSQPYADEAQPAGSQPYVPEEEADRLGPSPRPLRVAYENQPGTVAPRQPEGEEARRDPGAEPDGGRGRDRESPPAGYAASTRWTPSPHDPYAFSPEDAPGYAGKRATPMGPARTSPLTREWAEEEQGGSERVERSGIGGFYSPDEDEPREGPKLRVYLLWGLAISLLVLILLQFVLAMRVDGAPEAGAAAFQAGLVAYRNGDFAAARRHWEPVGDAGHAEAQYLLGFMQQNGLGQPWSNARAASWYRRAANQGHPEAQMALGDLYLRGMGVELDPRVGAAWYASAAVAGHPAGQFEYAKLLLHGTGVERDVSAALAWFEAAAKNGHEQAADYVAYANLDRTPDAEPGGAPPTEPTLP